MSSPNALNILSERIEIIYLHGSRAVDIYLGVAHELPKVRMFYDLTEQPVI